MNKSNLFWHYLLWMLNYSLFPPRLKAFKKIDATIFKLPLMTEGRHFYGSIEWRYRNKPIGHVHGNKVVGILFPKDLRTQLIQQEKVEQNKYARNGVSLYSKSQADIPLFIKLLEIFYQIVKNKTDEKIQQSSLPL